VHLSNGWKIVLLIGLYIALLFLFAWSNLFKLTISLLFDLSFLCCGVAFCFPLKLTISSNGYPRWYDPPNPHTQKQEENKKQSLNFFKLFSKMICSIWFLITYTSKLYVVFVYLKERTDFFYSKLKKKS
jgi:hypothetical protein